MEKIFRLVYLLFTSGGTRWKENMVRVLHLQPDVSCRAWHIFYRTVPAVGELSATELLPPCVRSLPQNFSRHAWNLLDRTFTGMCQASSTGLFPLCVRRSPQDSSRRAWYLFHRTFLTVPGTSATEFFPPCVMYLSQSFSRRALGTFNRSLLTGVKLTSSLTSILETITLNLYWTASFD